MFAVMSWTLYGNLNDLGVMFQQHCRVKSMDDRAAVLHLFRGSLGRQQISVPTKPWRQSRQPLLSKEPSLLTFSILSQIICINSSIVGICQRCRSGTFWTCRSKTAASAVFPHLLWFTNLNWELSSSWVSGEESAVLCPREQSCWQRQTGNCQRGRMDRWPPDGWQPETVVTALSSQVTAILQMFWFQSLWQLRKLMSFSPGFFTWHLSKAQTVLQRKGREKRCAHPITGVFVPQVPPEGQFC